MAQYDSVQVYPDRITIELHTGYAAGVGSNTENPEPPSGDPNVSPNGATVSSNTTNSASANSSPISATYAGVVFALPA